MVPSSCASSNWALNDMSQLEPVKTAPAAWSGFADHPEMDSNSCHYMPFRSESKPKMCDLSNQKIHLLTQFPFASNVSRVHLHKTIWPFKSLLTQHWWISPADWWRSSPPRRLVDLCRYSGNWWIYSWLSSWFGWFTYSSLIFHSYVIWCYMLVYQRLSHPEAGLSDKQKEIGCCAAPVASRGWSPMSYSHTA